MAFISFFDEPEVGECHAFDQNGSDRPGHSCAIELGELNDFRPYAIVPSCTRNDSK